MIARLSLAVVTALCLAGDGRLESRVVLDDLVRLADEGGRVLLGRVANHLPVSKTNRGPSGLATSSFGLLQEAARAQRAAATNPDAYNLHALGVSFLLLGDRERAVQLLEDSALQSPTSEVLNDLAVAYLELASDQRPDVLPAAVEAADRAVRTAPGLAAPLFNLAVALERLHLAREALAAWDGYLRLESQEEWRTEANSRIAAVRRSFELAESRMATATRVSASPLDAKSLGDVLARETDVEIREALLLEWIDRQFLRPWSTETLAGQTQRAAALVDGVSSLIDDQGDLRSSRELKRFIRECLQPPSHVATVAQALRDYHRGLTALDTNRTETAIASLTQASQQARRHCRPLHLQAELQLAIADYSRGALAASGRRLFAIESLPDDSVTPRLRAAVHRAHAMTDLARHDNANALRQLEAALDSARVSGDLVVKGRVLNNLADTLDVEGRRRESWHARLQALEIVARLPAAGLPTSVYGSAGLAVARGRQVRLGLAFTNAEGATAVATSGPIPQFLLESRRLDLHLAARNAPALRKTLLDAERLLANLHGDQRAPTLRTLLAPARASLFSAGSTEAMRVVDEAIAALGERVPSRAARLRLLRARSLVAGDDTAGAVDELHKVAGLLQRLGNASLAETVEASTTQEFGEVGRLLVSALVDRGAIDDALAIWTTVRSALNGEPSGPSPALPPGLALVQYAVLDGRVVAWLQSAGSATRIAVTDLPALQLAKSRLDTAVLQGGEREALNSAFTSFYDLLIVPLRLSDLHTTRLVVVPDAILAALPFGSFRNRADRTHLFEAMTVEMAWRVPGLFASDPPAANRRALVVADPGTMLARRDPVLAEATAEAMAVAAMYDNVVSLSSAEATAARVVAELPGADIVHWAGHAVVNDADGRYSYLTVAADPPGEDRLTVSRIASLRMRPGSLVILAACRSVSTPYRAFHARSLGEAFQKAGSRDVIGVAWDIPDNDARPFFEALHRELARGARPVVALTTVQRLFVSASPQKAGVALAAVAYVS